MQVTIVLDSGAFFDELRAGRAYRELKVGYFGSGPNVLDIRVLADGKDLGISDYKLKKGTIEVRQKDSTDCATGSIEITDALADSLLKKSELYPTNTPDFDETIFDCFLSFTSGRFCCSMVKERRFVEYDTAAMTSTGKDYTTRQIAHNVAVHFDLSTGDALEIKRQGDKDPIFSTADLPAGTRRVDIDVVADNTTAKRLFCYALKLTGHKSCWLPNQGDPPTLGAP
jgi:hypothetical protein